ncbi:hypothetical protein [Myroides guanonis]|uniref:Uncharacterized protein n=1 Tax=Myroides guanonis TaxID=1150112 RepID=A0A1I3R3M8_9FLAO|nr:hypothetical protein [Myroides guanonis]SFJ40968.1 hypothetical protein SAMN04487893_10740 [Myroides guanonis]
MKRLFLFMLFFIAAGAFAHNCPQPIGGGFVGKQTFDKGPLGHAKYPDRIGSNKGPSGAICPNTYRIHAKDSQGNIVKSKFVIICAYSKMEAQIIQDMVIGNNLPNPCESSLNEWCSSVFKNLN